MSHALVTIIAKIPPEKFDQARTFIEALGNPATEPVRLAFEAVANEPGDLAIHFSSLTVFPATAGGGHLVFEFSSGWRAARADSSARDASGSSRRACVCDGLRSGKQRARFSTGPRTR